MLPGREETIVNPRGFLIAASLPMLALALPARAGVPSPQTSELPAHVFVVGRTHMLLPDPTGAFDIVVRDIGNYPMPGAQVMVDFSGCPRTALCSVQGTPGEFVDCSRKAVMAYADDNGRATFIIEGAANFGPATGPGDCRASIYANNVYLGSVPTAVWDLDGASQNPGLGVTDYAWWLNIHGTGWYVTQADYNFNGVIEIVDFSMMQRHFGEAHSVVNCRGSFCGP
jgi:hypothetical protein